jgi:hypothetical protein
MQWINEWISREHTRRQGTYTQAQSYTQAISLFYTGLLSRNILRIPLGTKMQNTIYVSLRGAECVRTPVLTVDADFFPQEGYFLSERGSGTEGHMDMSLSPDRKMANHSLCWLYTCIKQFQKIKRKIKLQNTEADDDHENSYEDKESKR